MNIGIAKKFLCCQTNPIVILARWGQHFILILRKPRLPCSKRFLSRKSSSLYQRCRSQPILILKYIFSIIRHFIYSSFCHNDFTISDIFVIRKPVPSKSYMVPSPVPANNKLFSSASVLQQDTPTMCKLHCFLLTRYIGKLHIQSN